MVNFWFFFSFRLLSVATLSWLLFYLFCLNMLFRTTNSIMAAAGGPVLGATSPTLNHDDFCMYNYMSDDELMQLAIERSLTETHNNSTMSSAENTKSSVPQHRTQIPRPSQRQTPQPAPPPCPANPPRYRHRLTLTHVCKLITIFRI